MHLFLMAKSFDKIFVDATLGGGGHSALIASRLWGWWETDFI